MARRFLVARDPEPDSTLPYLLYVPVGAGLVLKARDTWPRTSRVYRHRVETGRPAEVEVLEDVAVLECQRRGVAVDLLLDRKREARSQFVFTRIGGGREGIFWQTRKVAATARPGARIPGRRISDLPERMTILIDTREHYPYRFANQQVDVSREALPAGDYAVRDASGRILAAVERSVGCAAIEAHTDVPEVGWAVDIAEAPRVGVEGSPVGLQYPLEIRSLDQRPEAALARIHQRPGALGGDPSGETDG